MTKMSFVMKKIDRSDVTVVVPTRNEAPGIERFLRAIPDDIALLVVDSSDDNTVEIVQRVRPSARISRAKVNIAVARQLGALSVSTEWILYTDADVAFASDYFDQLARLTVDPNVGGIVGVKATEAGFDRYHRWFLRGQRFFHALGIPAASGSNMLIRCSVLNSIGGFDPALSVNEDSEVMFRIKKAGWDVPLAETLRVLSFDHRRLELGVGQKVVHGALRNTALYLGWMPKAVRASDWGYWSGRHGKRPAGSTQV